MMAHCSFMLAMVWWAFLNWIRRLMIVSMLVKAVPARLWGFCERCHVKSMENYYLLWHLSIWKVRLP